MYMCIYQGKCQVCQQSVWLTNSNYSFKMFLPCLEMMQKRSCVSLRDKKKADADIKDIQWMLQFSQTSICFQERRSESRILGYIFFPTLDQTCHNSDLSQLVGYLTSNPIGLITARKAVVATWQNERRCQAVQVWVVASMRTAFVLDFGLSWRHISI